MTDERLRNGIRPNVAVPLIVGGFVAGVLTGRYAIDHHDASKASQSSSADINYNVNFECISGSSYAEVTLRGVTYRLQCRDRFGAPTGVKTMSADPGSFLNSITPAKPPYSHRTRPNGLELNSACYGSFSVKQPDTALAGYDPGEVLAFDIQQTGEGTVTLLKHPVANDERALVLDNNSTYQYGSC